MNILIVDDEKYVLDGIIQGVNWDRLPFENRYFAKSTFEAREILNQVPIHVLLCDIEMPQESGLDLLAWIREQEMDLQAVFLTGYAEFDYAKRAIQLGSFDYYLKPVDYEKLTDVLARVAEKVTVEEEIKRNSRLGEYWTSSESERKATFWSDIVSGKEKLTTEEIKQQAEKRKLSYTREQRYVILAIHLEAQNESDWRDEGMTHYQISNTYTECLEGAESVRIEAVWKESEDLWFMVLMVAGDSDESNLWKTVGGAASHMRKKLRKYYKEFAVYLSEETDIENLYDQVVQIRRMLFNNISYGNGVFFVCDYKPQSEEKFQIDDKFVEENLIEENEGELHKYIDQLMKELGMKKFLSPLTMQNLVLEWMQLVFLYLHKYQIEANRLFATDKYRQLYEKAEKNLSGCEEYLHYIVSESLKYRQQMSESEDIIEKIEQFIWDNLGENLTRASLTKVVYLNPDYLAYVFKKAKGISLIRYINNCRMEKAKELLLTTDENIYNIALQVGFPTSSYFAKQFKNYFGTGPSEYRKQKGVN